MGMLRYGYGFQIAIPAQHHTLFHSVTGMLVLGFQSCDSVDLLIVGYTFVYNDACGPSNTPPLPQKQDGGCLSGANDEAQTMESSFGSW